MSFANKKYSFVKILSTNSILETEIMLSWIFIVLSMLWDDISGRNQFFNGGVWYGGDIWNKERSMNRTCQKLIHLYNNINKLHMKAFNIIIKYIWLMDIYLNNHTIRIPRKYTPIKLIDDPDNDMRSTLRRTVIFFITINKTKTTKWVCLIWRGCLK